MSAPATAPDEPPPGESSAVVRWKRAFLEGRSLGVDAADCDELALVRETHEHAGRTPQQVLELVAIAADMIKSRRSENARRSALLTAADPIAFPPSSGPAPASPPPPKLKKPAPATDADLTAAVLALLADTKPDQHEPVRRLAANKALALVAPRRRSLVDDTLLEKIAEATGFPAKRLGAQLAVLRKPPAPKPKRVPAAPAATDPSPEAAFDPGSRRPRPPEIADGAALARMIDDAEHALLARHAPVYHRGGQLVRVRRGRGVTIEGLPLPSLMEILSEHVAWTRLDRTGTPVAVKPPKDVVAGLAARGTWSLREIHTLAEAPCLSAQGKVIEKDGWDESGVFVALDQRLEYPPVPAVPTQADAAAAVGRLFTPFSEFPFVGESDEGAALALVLTLVARPAIDGPTPLFLVRGPVAGSGKGKVVHVAAACAFGRQAAVSAPESDPAEERKGLLSLGAEGAPLALLDNLEHALGSDVLAAALTAPTFKGRVLGQNRTLEVRLPVLAATGNNLQVKGDLARRCVPIDLDPKVEQPESRAFEREQPAWALARHPELVVDALTILRGFVAAGRPQPPGAPFGSFEAWSTLVRSALLWAGAPDPLGGRSRLREDADTAVGELEALADAWVSGVPPASSAAQAIGFGDFNETLRDALVSFVGGDKRKLTPKRLTWALKTVRHRIVKDRRFVAAAERGTLLWSVESTDPTKPLPVVRLQTSNPGEGSAGVSDR